MSKYISSTILIAVNEEKCLNIKNTFKNQVRILSGNQNDVSEDCIRQLKSIKRILLGLKSRTKNNI